MKYASFNAKMLSGSILKLTNVIDWQKNPAYGITSAYYTSYEIVYTKLKFE